MLTSDEYKIILITLVFNLKVPLWYNEYYNVDLWRTQNYSNNTGN
jgi:hypothetical protein